MKLNRIQNAQITLKHKTQAAFPPYYLNIAQQTIPGTSATYRYTELVLTHGLPESFRGIHGHAIINAMFNYFKGVNVIRIPSYKKDEPWYRITRTEWQSFEFLTGNFKERYACAKLY